MNRKSQLTILTVISTYIIVRVVYRLTGFSYSLSEGILNMKLLIDLGLWIIVFFLVDNIFRKILVKSNN
jgi:hypothetical protein